MRAPRTPGNNRRQRFNSGGGGSSRPRSYETGAANNASQPARGEGAAKAESSLLRSKTEQRQCGELELQHQHNQTATVTGPEARADRGRRAIRPGRAVECPPPTPFSVVLLAFV